MFKKTKRFTLILIIVSAFATFLLEAKAVPFHKGMVLFLAFDEGSGEVAKDETVMKNNGQIKGTPEWVEGVHNLALRLSGDDEVYVPPDESFVFEEGDSITVSVWFKFIGDSSQTIISTFPGSEGTILFRKYFRMDICPCQFVEEPGLVEWNMNPTYVSPKHGVKLSKEANVYSKKPVNDGKWHHLAGVFDAEKEISQLLYVDGKKVAGKKLHPGIFNTKKQGICIGKESPQASPNLSATLDDLIIYRRALNKNEISRLMKDPYPVEPSEKVAITWGQLKE